PLDRRLKWLLRLLVSKEIGGISRGLVQGGIGSGFYANIYLLPVDQAFGSTNQWDVRLVRYVDDIIIIIPRWNDLADVLKELEAHLAELGTATQHGEDRNL
ncbi:MAG: reverse transcriptase domain-containing protein, partial [Anaerolineae bacterium]|nr:reverse transcriptase domain-containing protein [Anaerolineae bacterium]